MDTRAKIAEMLRKKREADNSARAPEERNVAPLQPPSPTAIKIEQTQHASALDRINEMLRKKQANAQPEPTSLNRDAQTKPTAPISTTPIQEMPIVAQPQPIAPTAPPFGYCACCRPGAPLIATTDRRITCPISGEEYVLNIDGSVAPKPQEISLSATNSLESALNDGNAAFYYGGFIVGNDQDQPATNTRRRRRR